MINGPAPRVRRVTPGGAVRYHDNSDPCGLYRIYDEAGELIYVGVSHEPEYRVGWHEGGKQWGHEVARYEVDWHPDRAAALKAEAKTVKAERPRHNVVHTPELGMRIREALAGQRARRARERQAAE